MSTFPVPSDDMLRRECIEFLHPGYPTPNRLLLLPRVDRLGSTEIFGVHHRTALLACQIVAGNVFQTGKLTRDQAGQQPVQLPLDGILTESVYYLMVGDRPDRYPVVPSFRDWEFPHGKIPDYWPNFPSVSVGSSSSISPRCAISNYAYAINDTHLVPRKEMAWFQRNDMMKYGDSICGDINSERNIIPLKADLHVCFDDRWFAIVPKTIATTTHPSFQYVTHILRPNAAELWPTYHNVAVRYLSPSARPFLFARFAWAVLLQVKPFITSNVPRYVIRVKESKDKAAEYKAESLDGPSLMSQYGGGASTSATPRNKRSRTDSAAEEEDEDDDDDDDDSDVSMDNDWHGPSQQSGKRRRRQMSSETTVEEESRAYQLTELKTQLERVLPEGRDELAQLSESPTG